MPIKKTPKAAEPAKPAKAPKVAPAKPAPAKAKSVKAAAPKKTPATKPAAPAKAAKVESPVTVVVRHDAGWGNHLHLRGEGPGLDWDLGAPMCCVHGDEWVWVAPAPGAVTFKILHNDSHWSAGGNIVVKPGETVTLRPVF